MSNYSGDCQTNDKFYFDKPKEKKLRREEKARQNNAALTKPEQLEMFAEIIIDQILKEQYEKGKSGQ